MGDLSGEFGSRQTLLRQWAHGQLDAGDRQAGETGEQWQLGIRRKLFEARMTLPRSALDVLLQRLQQTVLATMAQQELRRPTQVFLQLATRRVERSLQWAEALAGMPERERHK